MRTVQGEAAYRPRANPKGRVSLVLGVWATASTVVAIITADAIIAVCAVTVSVVGFPAGWQGHSHALKDARISKQSALLGEILNFVPWALLILWSLLASSLALVKSA